MKHTANPRQPPREARCTAPPHEWDDDAHGAIEASRLRAILDQRAAATARFRALKDRLLSR